MWKWDWTVGIFVLTAENSVSRLDQPAGGVRAFGFAFAIVGRSNLRAFLCVGSGRNDWELFDSHGADAYWRQFYELMSGFRFSSGYRVEMAALLVRNLVFPCLVHLCSMGSNSRRYGVDAADFSGASCNASRNFRTCNRRKLFADQNIAMISILITMVGSLVTLPIWLFLGLGS